MVNQPVLRMSFTLKIYFDKTCAFVFKRVFIRSSCKRTLLAAFYLAKCVMNVVKTKTILTATTGKYRFYNQDHVGPFFLSMEQESQISWHIIKSANEIKYFSNGQDF